MVRINEVLSPDTLSDLLRRLGAQFRSFVRRAGYRPERRYMRGRGTR